MGIVHFAPVGTSPGAVTTALSYLSHNRDNLNPRYDPEENGAIIESLVIFCSHEVRNGECDSETYIWNQYESTHSRQGWRAPRHWPNVLEIIGDFVEDEELLPEKGLLYAVPVNVNDYQACFNAIAQATLALARPDATGKWVWANLTGGTNILNAALMQAAALSGLIGQMYYTFVAQAKDRQYLHPFTSNAAFFDFVWLPLVKTTFDYGYYRLLEILEDGEAQMGRQILSQLKQDTAVQQIFNGMDFQHFKRQYLNRMTGDVLEEQDKDYIHPDRPVHINKRGREVLEYLHANELVDALIHREFADASLVQKYRDAMESYRLR